MAQPPATGHNPWGRARVRVGAVASAAEGEIFESARPELKTGMNDAAGSSRKVRFQLQEEEEEEEEEYVDGDTSQGGGREVKGGRKKGKGKWKQGSLPGKGTGKEVGKGPPNVPAVGASGFGLGMH